MSEFLRRFLCAAALLAATGAAAQPHSGWTVVQEDVVKPLAIGAYEASVKSHVAEHRDGPPCSIVRLTDLRYLALCDAVKLEGGIMLHGMGPVESSTVSIWQHRADLSYRPANPELRRDEETYVRFDLYYLLPGKEAEAEALTKEYRDLDRAIGFPHRWEIYSVAVGSDLPLMIQAVHGRSRLDLEARKPASDRLRGERALAINARVSPLLRQIGSLEGVVRSDLSGATAAPQ
jgi:hypothetical protein